MAFSKSSVLVTISMFLTFSAARNSTFNSTACVSTFDRDYGNFNASGKLASPGFRPSEGFPASVWTWTRYVMNTAESNNKTKTWETIGLETSPLLNLSDPNLPFRACLVAPMDFNQTNSKAANDDGTCSSVFSNECVTDMNKFLKNYAEEQAKGASSRTNCGGLGMLISRNVTSCKGISGSFTSGTFTGGQSKTKAGCEPFNAGRSGPGTGSLFGWSNGIQDGFMRYDNAITTPAPLFVIAWRNKTTGGGLWSDSRFMCVAANVTKAGSRSVQEARKSGAARLGVTSGLFIGLMSLLVVVL